MVNLSFEAVYVLLHQTYSTVFLDNIMRIILQSKIMQGWLPTCTYRYSSGHLPPIIQSCQNELLEIKYPLEYLQVHKWAPLFSYYDVAHLIVKLLIFFILVTTNNLTTSNQLWFMCIQYLYQIKISKKIS